MNKVVVVTGASSGIGKEVAKQYLQKGYVVVLSGKDGEKLREFEGNDNADIVIGDITQEETLNKIKNLFETKHKRIDILVNNAGITHIQPFEENTRQQLDELIAINLKAPMLLTQKLFPLMVKQHSGHIIIVNSTAGKEGKLNHTMYNASKFGLSGFAASLRLEAKKHNIRVTSFHPGGVKTALYDKLKDKPDVSTFMEPAKVAEILVYLSETEGLSPDEIVLNRMSK